MTERIHEQLVRIAHSVTRAGLVVAAGGNIAARLPGERVLVTPTGWPLAELAPAHLAEVTSDGRQVGGDYAPTSELALHLAALRARPDISWSLHLHPPMATLLHALGIPIRTITTDHAFYLRSIAALPYLAPGGEDVAAAAATAVGAGADVVLLHHHGCLVLADGPDLLLSRALNLEAAATATYRARLLGDDSTACPPEFLEQIRAREAAGRHYGARRTARPGPGQEGLPVM